MTTSSADGTGNAASGLRILVIEDDPAIGSQLIRGLARSGHLVTLAATAAEGLAAALDQPAPDVVLLDLGLPDLDGLEVCRQLRARRATPLIVITARGEEHERVTALDAGADDYLVKPFGFAELQARIRAVIRRVGPPATPDDETLRHGQLAVDLRTHR